jgi:hypothetical protein
MEGKIYQILKNHKLSPKKREEVLADLLLLLDEEQAKKMYSEEEVINLLQKYRYDLSSGKTPNIGDTTKYWFKNLNNK